MNFSPRILILEINDIFDCPHQSFDEYDRDNSPHKCSRDDNFHGVCDNENCPLPKIAPGDQ